MSQEGHSVIENKEFPSYTDIVVVRTPKAVPDSEIQRLKARFYLKGFLPIFNYPDAEDLEDDEREFPTDSFREVDNRIFEHYGGLRSVLKNLKGNVDDQAIETLRERAVEFDLKGGDYLHLNTLKIFLYASDPYYVGKSPEAGKVMLDLEEKGWQVFAVRTGLIVPKGLRVKHEDLDWLQSLFVGKDGKPHTIVPECFAQRVLPFFTTHIIPDEEAAKGACNVADLRDGDILLPVNKEDAPITNQILQEFAAAEIIELPPNFVDGGGGPRCSISSFRL
jgi:hypothetical protein